MTGKITVNIHENGGGCFTSLTGAPEISFQATFNSLPWSVPAIPNASIKVWFGGNPLSIDEVHLLPEGTEVHLLADKDDISPGWYESIIESGFKAISA